MEGRRPGRGRRPLPSEIGTIVSSPWTPVAATPLASAPSYDLPIMPVRPVVQVALTGPPCGLNALARPFSQSTTALPPSTSLGPPLTGQPSDLVVPIMSTARNA